MHAILIAETLNHVPVTFLLATDIMHLNIAIVRSSLPWTLARASGPCTRLARPHPERCRQ